MSIQIGDINIVNQLLDSEFRIGVLEKMLEKIINDNHTTLRIPNQTDLDIFRKKTAEELKAKYPNSWIEYKQS
jgi:hypothetical protein